MMFSAEGTILHHLQGHQDQFAHSARLGLDLDPSRCMTMSFL